MRNISNILILSVCALLSSCMADSFDAPDTPAAEVYGNKDIVNNDGTFNVPGQAKGKGGFMVDGSIGKTLRLRHGKQLSINLMLTNILNNRKLCTGGYEQSRSDYTVKEENGQTTVNNVRAYKFSLNPKKFYAFGINGMLNLTFRF